MSVISQNQNLVQSPKDNCQANSQRNELDRFLNRQQDGIVYSSRASCSQCSGGSGHQNEGDNHVFDFHCFTSRSKFTFAELSRLSRILLLRTQPRTCALLHESRRTCTKAKCDGGGESGRQTSKTADDEPRAKTHLCNHKTCFVRCIATVSGKHAASMRSRMLLPG